MHANSGTMSLTRRTHDNQKACTVLAFSYHQIDDKLSMGEGMLIQLALFLSDQ